MEDEKMYLFGPDCPQIHPLFLFPLSIPPFLLSSRGLIPEGARVSQAPMSASPLWISQSGHQQETGGRKWEARAFLPSSLPWACFRRHLISSMAPAPCRPAIRDSGNTASSLSFFSLHVPVNFCAYDIYLPNHLLFGFKDLPTWGWPIPYIKFSLLKTSEFLFCWLDPN